MMKLKSSRMTTVSTQSAGPARLGYQYLLDFTPPSSDCFSATFRAAEPPFGGDRKMSTQPVFSAYKLRLSLSTLTHCGERAPSLGTSSSKAVSLEPLLRRRIAHAKPLCNSLDRQTLCDQTFELFSIHVLGVTLWHARIVAHASDRKLRPSVTRPRAQHALCAGPGRRARG